MFARRELYLEGQGWVAANVYRFQDLRVNHVINGPAIVEYPGSTLFLAPDWEAKLDQFKCAHLTYLNGRK